MTKSNVSFQEHGPRDLLISTEIDVMVVCGGWWPISFPIISCSICFMPTKIVSPPWLFISPAPWGWLNGPWKVPICFPWSPVEKLELLSALCCWIPLSWSTSNSFLLFAASLFHWNRIVKTIVWGCFSHLQI